MKMSIEGEIKLETSIKGEIMLKMLIGLFVKIVQTMRAVFKSDFAVV